MYSIIPLYEVMNLPSLRPPINAEYPLKIMTITVIKRRRALHSATEAPSTAAQHEWLYNRVANCALVVPLQSRREYAST